MMRRNLVFLAIILVAGSLLVGYRLTALPTLFREGEADIVITLGADLSRQEKQQVLDTFSDWKGNKEVRYLTVSNAEERRYLEGLVDSKLIGSRAISSAYCELLADGKGIEVETENITEITPFMYANALATAGIEDARVVAAAPFPVSGTAALTGIIKAFEAASGEKLDEEAKETAHQEIAETSELGRKYGQGTAEKVIYEVKTEVVQRETSDPETIRKIILDVSADLNVQLSEQDVERIVELMQRINQLDVSVNQLSGQLQNLNRELSEVKNTGREAVSIFKQFIAALNRAVNSLQSLFTGG